MRKVTTLVALLAAVLTAACDTPDDEAMPDCASIMGLAPCTYAVDSGPPAGDQR